MQLKMSRPADKKKLQKKKCYIVMTKSFKKKENKKKD